jgi:hypothetical protein
MSKQDILEQAKQLLKHLQENPTDLKKFESAPTTAEVPAPKPTASEFKPYFMSQAKADRITELAKSLKPKEKAEKCMKEEEKAEADRDPNGEGEMGKEEMKEGKPQTEPKVAKTAMPAAPAPSMPPMQAPKPPMAPAAQKMPPAGNVRHLSAKDRGMMLKRPKTPGQA